MLQFGYYFFKEFKMTTFAQNYNYLDKQIFDKQTLNTQELNKSTSGKTALGKTILGNSALNNFASEKPTLDTSTLSKLGTEKTAFGISTSSKSTLNQPVLNKPAFENSTSNKQSLSKTTSGKTTTESDELSKFILKARKKLSRTNSASTKNTKAEASQDTKYEFVLLNRNADYVKLSRAIDELLLTQPNCTDPIFKLINHSIYDNLSDSSKQRYILNLSTLYNQILKSKKII